MVTFAYLADVFIINEYRGQGLGKFLVEKILNDNRFKDIKKWLLGTKDAHGLYKQFGFVKPPDNKYMEKVNFTEYKKE